MIAENLYALVEDLLTYDKFIEEIKKRRKKYQNLLSDEAIAYMIVDEYGRNPGNSYKIKYLIDGINATVTGTVIKISEVKKIHTKGRELNVQNMTIQDDTGVCNVVFWNNDIAKLENVKIGSKIKIINGYVKENEYGLTVSLGKWGMFIVL